MKALIPTSLEVPMSLVLDDEYNRMAEQLAAQQALGWVLDGHTADFTDEEVTTLAGLSRALQEGEHDTRYGDIERAIQGFEAGLLLDAMNVFVSMPAEDRVELTETGEFQVQNAALALAGLTHILLDPDVSREELIQEIVPKGVVLPSLAEEPQETTDEYAWLSGPADFQVAAHARAYATHHALAELVVPVSPVESAQPSAQAGTFEWPSVDWPTEGFDPFSEAAVRTDDHDQELASV